MLASGAVKEAALELFPQFEKASGNKVAVTWAGTVDIKKKIAAGEVFDLVIVASPELDTFAKDGKIVAGSKVDLVRSSVGVAVKAGAPKPDLKSGDDLKKALLAAKSVGYSTGPSGVYHGQSLFDKMGIADRGQGQGEGDPAGRAGCHADQERRRGDRLPAGQRTDPRSRHRLHRADPRGRSEHHRVLERRARPEPRRRSKPGRCRNSSPRPRRPRSSRSMVWSAPPGRRRPARRRVTAPLRRRSRDRPARPPPASTSAPGTTGGDIGAADPGP